MDGNTPSAPASLALSRLRVWPGNPRRTVPDLTTLTESVRKVGVLAPLLVRELAEPIEEGHESNGPEGWVVDKLITHEVIAGQCRYLAATAAGLAEVPVTVREVDDATALELGLTENAQRSAPAPMEEAEALDALVRTHGRTVEEVAARLGHPAAWVRRRLSLLTLIREARAWLSSGKLPLGHALTLAAVDEATQLRVVERHRHNESLPPSKAFAADVTTYLRTLASAPFDAAGCAGCSTRTDVQTDLFSTAPESARCLGPTCWDTKVAEVWTAAQKAAKKRRLPVIAEPIEHDWRGLARMPDGRLLTATAPSEDARPAAVARDRWGRVVELYAPPPSAPGAPAAPAATTADDEEGERELAELHATRERRKAEAKAERLAALARLVGALATTEGHAAGLRAALLTCARDLEMSRDLRAVLEARAGVAVTFSTDADLVADLSNCDLSIVLAATILSAWALDKDVDDATNYERTLRELVRAPAVAAEPAEPAGRREVAKGCVGCGEVAAVLRPGESAKCLDCGVTTTRKPEPAAAPATARLWIAEAAWDALTPDARDDLAEPFGGTVINWQGTEGFVSRKPEPAGGTVINWQGTEGFVYADVPRDETLTALQGMAEALLVEMHEGAERPAAAPHAEAPLRVRAVLLTDAGDWAKCRKGLPAWSAEKTPGAGAVSGGSNAPLVLLWTSEVASPDVAKLFAKLAKERRTHLDLGEVPAADVLDYAPSNRAVRERWNEAHPAVKVGVAAKKGGAK